MDVAKLLGLEQRLSPARLARYLDRYNGNRVPALRLYTWNIEASAALWGPISVIEVAVRNAMHEQLVERCRRPDWWEDAHLYLCPRERDAVTHARDKLVDRGTSDPSADQVVAATSFGLWSGLVSEGKPRDRLYSYETTLWQPRLRNAFPHRGDRGRKYVHSLLEDIRKLRNRIAHHEPIWAAPLDAIHDSMLELAAMIDPDVRTYIEHYSRVPETIARRRAALESGDIRF